MLKLNPALINNFISFHQPAVSEYEHYIKCPVRVGPTTVRPMEPKQRHWVHEGSTTSRLPCGTRSRWTCVILDSRSTPSEHETLTYKVTRRGHKGRNYHWSRVDKAQGASECQGTPEYVEDTFLQSTVFFLTKSKLPVTTGHERALPVNPCAAVTACNMQRSIPLAAGGLSDHYSVRR